MTNHPPSPGRRQNTYKLLKLFQRTLKYNIAEVQHLNYRERLNKQMDTPFRNDVNVILLDTVYLDNTTHGAKYRGSEGHKMKTRNHPKTWNWLCYRVPTTQQTETQHNQFELHKFQELIHDEPKMPNYVTVTRSNSILDQLYLIEGFKDLQRRWSLRLGCGSGLPEVRNHFKFTK